eukprot:507557-Pleurochrysis_carterae.AAC.4
MHLRLINLLRTHRSLSAYHALTISDRGVRFGGVAIYVALVCARCCSAVEGKGCKAQGEVLKSTHSFRMALFLYSGAVKRVDVRMEGGRYTWPLRSACCGRIGDEGCKALAEVLKTNKALTSLKITGAQRRVARRGRTLRWLRDHCG